MLFPDKLLMGETRRTSSIRERRVSYLGTEDSTGERGISHSRAEGAAVECGVDGGNFYLWPYKMGVRGVELPF
jgi:hypothetical protein